MSGSESWSCRQARHSVHRRLDGEPLAGDERERLESHLAACHACREADTDLRSIQTSLRSLPLERFPDARLEDVFRRTVRAERPRAVRRSGLDWRLAAAAAITVAITGIWYAVAPPASRPSARELERAAAETRVVLGLTAHALRRAERTATREVIAKDVAATLRRLPIRLEASQ